MYKPTIGLEIHAELKTNSKMFCSCKNDPDEKRANFNICPVCTAQPGSLPVINETAVKSVIKTGLALNCQIATSSKFDRKNYFYPDLPKGYQISQYDKPLCQKGYLEINGKKIRITRIHLEEDTGRLIHDDNSSLVDLNRAGIPLMELVTEPDITSGKDAKEFAEELWLIFRYLGVSNADMEKGQMRVEVNISVSDTDKLGTKVEIKNLNSFRVVEKAVDFEIKRQTEALENGEKIVQETRGWNDKKEITFSQREKEEANDYRYFPEPDLPTLNFKEEYIRDIEATLPELPAEKRKRFAKEFGLDNSSIEFFVSNCDLSEYYEKVVSEFEEWIKESEERKNISNEERNKLYKTAANYLITDIKGSGLFDEKTFKISPENFAEFITLIYEAKISSKIAKIVLAEMLKTGADPTHIIEDKGLSQITDESEIENIVKSVIENNKKSVDDFKAGKQNALQYLIGQVMKESRGKANPESVARLLKNQLK